jgi:hypothetical protein
MKIDLMLEDYIFFANLSYLMNLEKLSFRKMCDPYIATPVRIRV